MWWSTLDRTYRRSVAPTGGDSSRPKASWPTERYRSRRKEDDPAGGLRVREAAERRKHTLDEWRVGVRPIAEMLRVLHHI